MSRLLGTSGVMRSAGLGKPRPPGTQGDPGAMGGRREILFPTAAKPSRNVSASGPDEREVEPHRLGDRELVAPLARPVVVDALALTAVLEAVLEGVRIEPAERPGDAGARGGEALDVVVELQLEEIAVLADVPRRGA